MALNLTTVFWVGILLLGLLAYTRLAQRLDQLGASLPRSEADALRKIQNEVKKLRHTVQGLGAKEPPVPRVLLGHLHHEIEGLPKSGGIREGMPLTSIWNLTDPHGVVLREMRTDWWAERAEENAAAEEATRGAGAAQDGEGRSYLSAMALNRVHEQRAERFARAVFPVFKLHRTDCGYDILL